MKFNKQVILEKININNQIIVGNQVVKEADEKIVATIYGSSSFNFTKNNFEISVLQNNGFKFEDELSVITNSNFIISDLLFDRETMNNHINIYYKIIMSKMSLPIPNKTIEIFSNEDACICSRYFFMCDAVKIDNYNKAW